jgi:hypothetical protein
MARTRTHDLAVTYPPGQPLARRWFGPARCGWPLLPVDSVSRSFGLS